MVRVREIKPLVRGRGWRMWEGGQGLSFNAGIYSRSAGGDTEVSGRPVAFYEAFSLFWNILFLMEKSSTS